MLTHDTKKQRQLQRSLHLRSGKKVTCTAATTETCRLLENGTVPLVKGFKYQSNGTG